MKEASLASFQKLGLRPDEAAAAIGSVDLFTRMVKAGWLKPVIKGNRLTLYSTADVAYAFERLKAGQEPAKLKR